MKVKVSVPTEPVCTIKLEIDEAKALLAGMVGYDGVLAPREAIQAINETLKQALAAALKVDLEPSLFDATNAMLDATKSIVDGVQENKKENEDKDKKGKEGKKKGNEEPPQIEGGKDDE